MINNIYSKFLFRFILLFFCSFIILEILIRVVDENCYSFFPVYMENEIEKLPKNKNRKKSGREKLKKTKILEKKNSRQLRGRGFPMPTKKPSKNPKKTIRRPQKF